MNLARRASGDQVLGARLKLVGSCRGPGDEVRIEVLRAEAESLGIADSVDWCAAPIEAHGRYPDIAALTVARLPPAGVRPKLLLHIPRCAMQRYPKRQTLAKPPNATLFASVTR